MVVIIVIGLLLSACDLQNILQCDVPEVGADVLVASGAAAGTEGTVLNTQQLAGGTAVTLAMADGTALVIAGCFSWVIAVD